ncbi:ATP-dependent RNA helicase HrpA [Nitrosomonas oligotropha]|uniref:ATP-dependent helicase HrpA n=1 Tax=Nitrosomonas oligotropha TaxID=42354 RepID=A0A1H8S0V8_9PROT|nr:ATP-dependent RNA helicase HrpA [Nitrosomonas oligotropha]SDX00299.1 ATP-dependent helicase HrpA [Nitrosomonas oligotropha]SEO72232.1 ATP-dependent helicase HrpA [Nitrosomonas oligotropha]
MKKLSPEVIAKRLAHLPHPTYAEDLPVNTRREEIKQAIENHQVVIICGETGSGKTTQIPKICLELKRGVHGLIGHTQPRRIAARTVAGRIAAELNSPLGQAVGYKVRFTDKIGADSYIKLMTDGILLAETQGDPLLQAYDTLIIDEAHERSLNIDFLLGYLKQLLPKRPDLKLIVTSATIDAQRFSRHFNDAPVIEVSGRLYPVDIYYHPPLVDDEEDGDMQRAIIHAADELMALGSGDILVFLPGEREIRETAETLRKHSFHRFHSSIEILPLFARLSVAEQERVFQPDGARRIVLATNVAETSLTVPGIHYVIDTGLARINRYSYRNKVEQLLVEKISQASANQRAGRCGRVANGVCIRLYSEQDFQGRTAFTDPEILRSSLASVILRMKSLKIGDVEDFPFLEPPSPRMIADGYQLLAELGAVDDSRNLTDIGWRLAKFPIDPKIARMILAAKQENCLHEILIIASALSLQDPRDRPFEQQAAADNAHRRFQDERSDFLAYLKLWDFFDDLLKHKKSGKKLMAQCREHFLSYRRLREWREVHGQLHVLMTELGFKPNEIPAGYDEIHRALLPGLLGNIGFKTEKEGEYLGARGIKFAIFPGSVLKKGKAKWVVAAELVETSKLYARCAAKIEPQWLERIAANLCKKHYFDPHWEKKQAQVIVYERVTLYGLVIVQKRPVHYGSINPKESREIFIRSALVAGEYVTQAPFFAHNQALIEEIEALEHKARRQDVLVDEQEIFAFYDAIVPANITNGAGFEKWRKQAEQSDAHLLYLQRELLMRHQAGHITEVQFPETMTLPDGSVLPLTYRFDPGHVLDGVTVSVPLPLLNRLDTKQLDYLVPGLIREKITWYLKALPKQIRRILVPLPESVTGFLDLQTRPWQQMSLQEALEKFIVQKTSLTVPAETWQITDMPSHLLMNIRVLDDAGQELAMSRNLAELQTQLGKAAQMTFVKRDAGTDDIGIERDAITQWDFGDLPVEVPFKRNGQPLTGYPALIDKTDNAAIRLFDTRQAADSAMRLGVRRLLCLTLKDQLKQIEKNLPGLKQASVQLVTRINPGDLKQDMLDAIVDRALLHDDPLPRTAAEFAAHGQRARSRLPEVTAALARLLQQIGSEYQLVLGRLASTRNDRVKSELDEQLGKLIYPGFLSKTAWQRLQQFPRYLKGMALRLEKLTGNPERDERNSAEITPLWRQYLQHCEKHQKISHQNDNLDEFRWQIEELRISLFAQELKTPFPVSVKRLQKLWESVQA